MAFDTKGRASEDLQWLTRGDKELEAVLSEKLAHFLNISKKRQLCSFHL